MDAERRFCRNVFLAVFLGMAPICLHAQPDSVGFPLDIGNKWFYRYQYVFNGATVTLQVRQKEIIDTTQNGQRVVRVSILGSGTTVGMESWAVIGGSLFIDSTLFYDSLLTRDTTWTIISGGRTDTYALLLRRVSLWGFDRKCQIRQYHWSQMFGSGSTDRRTALGIGHYYDYSGTATIQSVWNTTFSLIGFEKNGVLYGDTILTSVEQGRAIQPPSFVLSQNYPNPFNPQTTIAFTLAQSSQVSLTVFNLAGQQVAVLVNGQRTPGLHRIDFNAATFPSGVYFYQLEADEHKLAKRMLLLK